MKNKIIFIITIIAIAFAFGCIGTKEIPMDQNSINTTHNQNEKVIIPQTTKTHNEGVIIDFFAFSPNILKISPGTTVIWENKNKNVIHEIRSGYILDHKQLSDGIFESGDINYGEKWEHTFNKEGEYSYYSPKYPQMQGLIVVGNWKNYTIQIMTPHFVGSIPPNNKTLNSLDEVWITFSVPILNGSSISIYDIGHHKKINLTKNDIDRTNYLRLHTKFTKPLEPSLYKVSYTEVTHEGTYYGQFFFKIVK